MTKWHTINTFKTFKYSDLLINVSWKRELFQAIGKLWNTKSNQRKSLSDLSQFFIEALLHGRGAHNGSVCSVTTSALLQVKACSRSSNHFLTYGFGIFSPCFTLPLSPQQHPHPAQVRILCFFQVLVYRHDWTEIKMGE